MAKKDKTTNMIPEMGEGRNAIKYWVVNENLSTLLGEILTVVDASTEGDKNKAMKDLIRNSFSKRQDWIFELAWKEERDNDTASDNNPRYVWESGLIPLNETDESRIYYFKH